MTLPVWLGRGLGVRIAAAVLGLAALLQLTDLFEAAPRLLEEGRGAAGVALYALLRTPDLLVQAAPLGVLAGALFGFGRLARDGAVTSLRAAGLSGYSLAAIASPAAAAVALLLLGLGAVVAPRADAVLADWLGRRDPAASGAAPRREFRLGRDIVTASRGDDAGARLAEVDVSAREPDGRLARRLTAREAVRGPGGRWRLRDVRWEAYGRGGGGSVAAGRVPEMAWTDRLEPADVRALWTRDAPTPPSAAARALRGGAAPLPLSVYRVQLARLWATPVGAVVMLLIAAPAALGQARDGGVTRLTLGGLAGGLAFLVADGVLAAAGSAGVAPAWAAAWGAPVLFAAGALAVLMHLEG